MCLYYLSILQSAGLIINLDYLSTYYNSQRPFFKKKGILKVCKAFLSRICHAVVFTQFGYANSKCQALYLVFPFQN